MRLLLDTHVLIWIVEGRRRLGKKAAAMIGDGDSQIWLSAASVWEMAIKTVRGKLRAAEPLRAWLPARMREGGFLSLAVTHEHAIAAAELPRYHEDPFDRMLIGQAQVEDLRIITADAQFGRYDVRVIDATD